MATHASILAWRIPWTEEPGGLQSMGSQRVGHNRSNLAHREEVGWRNEEWLLSLFRVIKCSKITSWWWLQNSVNIPKNHQAVPMSMGELDGMHSLSLGFPGGSVVKHSPAKERHACLTAELGRRRAQQPTPVLLPGESHGQRSLVGYSPWGHRESDTPERLSMHTEYISRNSHREVQGLV